MEKKIKTHWSDWDKYQVVGLSFENNIAYIALNQEDQQGYELQTGGTACHHPVVTGKLIELGYEYHEIIEELQGVTEEADIELIEDEVDKVLDKMGLSLDRSRYSEEGMIAIRGFTGDAFLIYENSD